MSMSRRERVLVVDDSEEVLEFAAVLLEDAGYTVERAADGLEAFDRAQRSRPDLILLDVVMPRMDGFELLGKMRSNLAPPLPRVVLCSGFDLTEEEAIRRGATRFLRKPVAPSDLLRAVTEVNSSQAPPAWQLQSERARSSAARRRALDDASELMEQIEEHAEPGDRPIDRIATEQIEALTRFFAVEAGVIAVVRRDALSVVASVGHAALTQGSDFGLLVPAGYEVLETGSSLMLTDASTHPSFAGVGQTLGGVRYFIAVPLCAPSSVPVGLLAVFDPFARTVEAEDVATVQLFGRSGSVLLALLARGASEQLPGHWGGGVWKRAIFEQVLDDELRLFQREGGSMVLAVAKVRELSALKPLLARARSRERLMCGVIADGRAALCKRSRDGAAAASVTELLADLRSLTEVKAAGIIDLAAGGLKLFVGSEVVRLAELALDRASETSSMLTLSLHVDATPLR
jgi:twitching motility two-component system response regulator PilH